MFAKDILHFDENDEGKEFKFAESRKELQT